SAILVVRVVHLWTWRQAVQRFVFGFFAACIVTVGIIFGFVMKDTDAVVLPLPLRGCFDVSIGQNAHLYWGGSLIKYLPTEELPAVLVILTVVRVARPLQKSDYDNKLLKCLIRDGCLFYFCVSFKLKLLLACVGFGVVGSALWNNPHVSLPAIFSGFLPVILSICASRLLFNLHELAEELVGQPTFALNNVELGRLNLHKGPRHGEFIVNVDCEAEDSTTSHGTVESEAEEGLPAQIQAQRANRDWLPYINRLSKFHIGNGVA
ncbi:hypothetical protein DFH11DRAFT_1516307, partial [Phellopilus nigrolimitatus]